MSDQDTSLWSSTMIDEADRLLADAARMGVMGSFQLEAAYSLAIGRCHGQVLRGLLTREGDK
jgi:predicted RNA polymerase sigma factor